MSQRRKEEKQKSSTSSFEASLAAGAAVVGVAAVAYGAWKLYDMLSSPSSDSSEGAAAAASVSPERKSSKKRCDSSDEDEVSLPSNRRSQFLERDVSALSLNKEVSLSAKLLNYYNHYVYMSPSDMKEAMKLVKNVKLQVSRHLENADKLQSLGVYEIKETGSSTNDLMVIIPENFDILIPFQLDSSEWYITQHCEAAEYFSVALQNCNKIKLEVCDDQRCAVPSKIVRLLRTVLEESILACRNASMKLAIHTDHIAVEGYYGTKPNKLTINVVPAVKFGTRCFVPQCFPDQQAKGSFYWRESFAAEEDQYLNRFGRSTIGHKIVLKVFKAIRLNFPLQFGLLTSYHYKTVLFRIMDDQADATDWETPAISERCIDFLIELGNCLKERNLPHHFQPGCNLLDQISPEASQNLAHFINKIVGHQDIASLLKYNYN